MTTRTTLLSLILFCTTRLFAQSPSCNCETNFKWVKTTFEKNDAGFQYIIQQKGMDAYRKHTAAFLPKIKQTTDKQVCADLMNQWLLFFRKAHFWVAPIAPQASSQSGKSSKPWPSLDIPESQIKDRSAEPNANPWTGIWQTGAYTLGIFSHQGSFKGIILQSANPTWKPGQVKLSIEKNGAGDFYMGDRTPQHFTKATLIGKNGLKLGSIDLTRIFPVFKEDEKEALYVKEMSAGNPFIEKLSDKTILFRIPSFDGSQKPLIDSLIAVYDQTLRQTENLVIDIRDNGGGDDDSYEKILPYIYTNPIRVIPLDLYSTPLNNKRMEEYLSIPNLSENSKKQVYAALKKLNDHLGQFVGFNEEVSIDTLGAILPFPKQVAVIVNGGNGSTAEQFLLAAKQSRKVKLFGTTTMGVLDISNMYAVESPAHEFRLSYCISKSRRIPDMAIDGKGITPDFYLDKSIPPPDWLTFVVHSLE